MGDSRSQPKPAELRQEFTGRLMSNLDGEKDAEIASLKARIQEQDELLAEAADFLNYSRGMDAMDCGAKITAYRFAQQKSARAALEAKPAGETR